MSDLTPDEIVRRASMMGLCSQTYHEHLMRDAATVRKATLDAERAGVTLTQPQPDAVCSCGEGGICALDAAMTVEDADSLRAILTAFGERLAAIGLGWEAIVTREGPDGEETVAHMTTANPERAALRSTPAAPKPDTDRAGWRNEPPEAWDRARAALRSGDGPVATPAAPKPDARSLADRITGVIAIPPDQPQPDGMWSTAERARAYLTQPQPDAGLREALEWALLKVADRGYRHPDECSPSECRCGFWKAAKALETADRAALRSTPAAPEPAHPDDDFVARAQAYRAEHEATHEDEMCGGPCIVLGLAGDDEPSDGTIERYRALRPTPAAPRDPIRVMVDGSADASDMMPGPEQPAAPQPDARSLADRITGVIAIPPDGEVEP